MFNLNFNVMMKKMMKLFVAAAVWVAAATGGAWAQTPQMRTLDSIPQGWTVQADGTALTWTAYEGSTTMGYVQVPAGAEVTVTTPAGLHVGTMKVRYGVVPVTGGDGD